MRYLTQSLMFRVILCLILIPTILAYPKPILVEKANQTIVVFHTAPCRPLSRDQLRSQLGEAYDKGRMAEDEQTVKRSIEAATSNPRREEQLNDADIDDGYLSDQPMSRRRRNYGDTEFGRQKYDDDDDYEENEYDGDDSDLGDEDDDSDDDDDRDYHDDDDETFDDNDEDDDSDDDDDDDDGFKDEDDDGNFKRNNNGRKKNRRKTGSNKNGRRRHRRRNQRIRNLGGGKIRRKSRREHLTSKRRHFYSQINHKLKPRKNKSRLSADARKKSPYLRSGLVRGKRDVGKLNKRNQTRKTGPYIKVTISVKHRGRQLQRHKRTGRAAEMSANWQCEMETDWKRMDDGYFPPYLQTGKCKSKSCFFDFYRCIPKRYTIKVLKRDPFRCNPIPTFGQNTTYEEKWIFDKYHVTVCCQCGKARLRTSRRRQSNRRSRPR
uniref:TGF-beta family profile domain-containing protein n=2 Tax=Octopus bimaculoides TaxID=37653 RepID=A0A0L8ICN3_OCTBM